MKLTAGLSLSLERPHAPWCLVEAEDDRYARIEVLRTIVDGLEQRLRRSRGVLASHRGRVALPAAGGRWRRRLDARR